MSNSLVSLTVPDIGSWQLSGQLTVESVSESWRQLNKKRPAAGAWSIDCNAVHQIDSAGLAYLLSCIRYANKKKVALSLTNLPSAVDGLIRVQGLSELFKNL